MGFNVESIMKMPVLADTIANAIEDGRNWGQKFHSDYDWCGDRSKMANHAIYESTLWSVGSGMLNGALGMAGIPSDVAITLYSQVKLASALFTIHGIDTQSKSAQPVILAAAAGVSLAELANQLGTRIAAKAIEKALIPAPARMLMKINQTLAVKLISKVGGKGLANAVKILPAVGSVVSGSINAVTMNACGHSVLAFIKTWKSA